MSQSYDLIVVGAGSGGLTAADIALQLGLRVALVEKNRVGGDCTWSGCVPSKTLLKAAQVAHQMRNADQYGLASAAPAVDLKAVMSHVQEVIAGIYEEESPEALRAKGIDVYLGATRFLDAHTLAAGEQTLTARYILLATGAHVYIPSISGLQNVDYWTYETVWQMEELPRHLLVLGAGPVGSELAQAFRRLGSEVSLLAAGDQILPKDDPDASLALANVFETEGIDIVYHARAEIAWQDSEGIHVGAGGQSVVGDTLLIASGRRPNVKGLDLEKAGVDYDETGIAVDANLRTSQPNVYAAGDCTGGLQFTHYAGFQAAMAVRNAFLPGATKGITEQVPWTTFTDPQVAQAGLTEDQAREQHGGAVMTCEWPMSRVDRARTDGNTAGFLKLVHKKDGALLGATIVAAQAGEMIHEWIVALEQGIKIGELSSALHVYPTYSVAGMQAAAAIRMEWLLGGTVGKVVRTLAQRNGKRSR